MSKAMSMAQLGELLKHIQQEHSPLRRSVGKAVKYVHPNIDMRTSECFSISLRGFSFDEVVFHTQNECRNLPDSLFDRVMVWLDDPNTSTQYSIKPPLS